MVDSVFGNKQLQNRLNIRDAEGYDLVWIAQTTAYGANMGRDVVFKRRSVEASD